MELQNPCIFSGAHVFGMDQIQLQRAAKGSHDTETLAEVVVDLVLHDFSRTQHFLGALLPIQGSLARRSLFVFVFVFVCVCLCVCLCLCVCVFAFVFVRLCVCLYKTSRFICDTLVAFPASLASSCWERLDA